MKKLEKYGVVILYIATIAGLAFSFFGSVLNSRILSKELFGDWKYVQNYLVMLSFFVNLGFYYTGGRLIASTEDKTRIAMLKGYMLYISVAGLAVMFLATVVIGVFWQKLLSPPLFKLILSMFPLFIIHPLMFYFESIFQAERRMIPYAVYKILPPALYVALLYILKSYSTGSIYFNAMLYYATYFIVFAYFIIKDKQIFRKKTGELTELLTDNKTYGIHLFYGSLWNVGASYMLPLLIGFFNINNIEVGNFSLALSFIIPFTFLPAIVGTSYFKEFIKLDKIPLEALKKVIISSGILLLVTLFSIDFFINLFLGARYAEVAFLVKIGALGGILHGFGDFTNKFLSAKGNSTFIKKVAIIVGVVQLISSLFLIKWLSATGAMIARSLGSIAYFGCLYVYYYRNYVAVKISSAPGTA